MALIVFASILEKLPLPTFALAAMCGISLCTPVEAIAADSMNLSDYFVITRIKRGGNPRLDLQVRTQQGGLSYIGSIPDPGYEKLMFDRLSGIKGSAGAPLVSVSPDGRSVAFFHWSDLVKRQSGQESGVYFYEYDKGIQRLLARDNFLGLPSSQRTDVPVEILTFELDKVAGGTSSVPWAVSLTTNRPEQFPLALLAATDLHRAAYDGDVPKISQLLDNAQDINAQTYWGHTPLYVAIVSYEEQSAIYLVERGADLTTGDSTYLHLAAAHGQSDLIETILDRGVDVNTVDSIGKTALHVASEAYRSGVSNVFRHRRQVSPEAALRRVATLLAHGANPNAKTGDGDGAFHYLARIVAQPDLPAWANQSANLLINAGADAAAQNSRGNTPLHIFSHGVGFGGMAPTRSERIFAVEAGGWEKSETRAMLAVLVSLTPDIDARNSDGLTALQLALRSNHMLTAQYLLANGADALVPDANGVIAKDRIDRALASSGWQPVTDGKPENR